MLDEAGKGHFKKAAFESLFSDQNAIEKTVGRYKKRKSEVAMPKAGENISQPKKKRQMKSESKLNNTAK